MTQTLKLLTSKRGVNQGCPLAALLYSTALRHANDVVLDRFPTVTVSGVADDRFFMGPINDVLEALDLYLAELRKQSQTLQPTKTVIYHPSTPTINGTETIADLCAARNYTAGPGFLAAGSPVGDPAYCRSTIENLFTAIAEKIDAIRTLSHVSAGRTALG